MMLGDDDVEFAVVGGVKGSLELCGVVVNVEELRKLVITPTQKLKHNGVNCQTKMRCSCENCRQAVVPLSGPVVPLGVLRR